MSLLGEAEPMKPYHDETKIYRVIRFEETEETIGKEFILVRRNLCKWLPFPPLLFIGGLWEACEPISSEALAFPFGLGTPHIVDCYIIMR